MGRAADRLTGTNRLARLVTAQARWHRPSRRMCAVQVAVNGVAGRYSQPKCPHRPAFRIDGLKM